MPTPSRFLLALLTALAATATQAQTARKPSFYENDRQLRLQAPADRYPPEPAPDPHAVPEMGAIRDRADFDNMARIYNSGTPYELPHMLFVIDRQAKGTVYYVNSRRFDLHERFVRDYGVLPGMSASALKAQYRDPKRRFLFGTLAWQANLDAYTYEFWEGDILTPELLKETRQLLTSSFYAPLRFKTNATQHEEVARQAAMEYTTQEALLRGQRFLPLNTGRAQGRLRILNSVENARDLQPDDIVVLDEVPISLPPVAGVVTQRPSTLLSHVNLLAKGWRIPNAYVKNAAADLKDLDGRWVELVVTTNNYSLQAAIKPEVKAGGTRQAGKLPRPDLSVTALKTLDQLAQKDSRICGVKAANLGALRTGLPPGATVPDGFCIPYAHYERFMQKLGIPAQIAALAARSDFQQDRELRRRELDQLRQKIVAADIDPALVQSWQAQWQKQLAGSGVFVRSSSNSEDLPDFSGAGLYTTVPNVTDPQKFASAVKTVWASVYNFEAYEARRAAGIPEGAVVMAVLVQRAAKAESAGVLITRDPFDASRSHATYIAAKRGLGIKVVDGQRQAEQLMYSSWSNAVQLLTRSAETTQLVADAQGGVKEAPVEEGRRVLNDELVRRLAAAGKAIKQKLGKRDQDIEWAASGDQIYILQSRPYVDGSR